MPEGTLLDPACHLDIARAIITRNDRRAYSLSVAGVAADLLHPLRGLILDCTNAPSRALFPESALEY
ncbi:hypothetical protein Agabi119p4_5084 [Agaricus bisporus var. burnettii]|uniref:Uncharacterized protein n=1 Tax=Agaricus bisporus var. burnettii TaxID=192524 RepID=A0A8H7F4G8_AGABI|nr:hypothetical protein Agabi119p4_5084 [Agaricus bisporus var. burnettii]